MENWVEHKMPFCLYQAQRPSPIFTSKAVSIKACGVKGRLKPIIENLKEQGLLISCNSPCNTPILGVKELQPHLLFVNLELVSIYHSISLYPK